MDLPSEALDPAHRDAGDAARDRRDWAEAERHYRAWLGQMPQDAAIWVQLGHATKEQGKAEDALAAYARAGELAPDDPDPLVQYAHLLKLAGRRAEAIAAYAEALKRAPVEFAAAELEALGAEQLAEQVRQEAEAANPVADRLWLEITDLFVYLHDHRTVSGIQRVQLGLVAHVLALPAEERAQYGFVTRIDDDPLLYLLPTERVAALAEYLVQPVVERAALDRMLKAAKQAAARAPFQPGQALVVLGAFWVGSSVAPAYAAAKAAGLALGACIYDLIPVTHPEFCDDTLVREFGVALAEGMALFDFLLAISEHSARELRAWLAREGLDLPVEAVPLAHDFRLPGQAPPPEPARWPVSIAALQGREYVLCVGTIEVRKNHHYLFRLWQQLLAEGIEPPTLVLVGRQGWRVADFTAQLQATGFLGGRIRVVHDLTDAELATLYRHCLFTVFPSLTEGWGLPVGESLTYGRACIASNAASIPEVGGGLVEYIDPANLHSGLVAVRRWLHDRAQLAQREAEIRDHFRPRGWAEVGERFFATARRLAATPPRPLLPPKLAQGELFRPAALHPRAEPAPPPRALRLVLA